MARRGGNPRVSIQGDADGVTRATKQAEGSLDRMSQSGSKSLGHLKTAALATGAALAGGIVIGLKESAEAAIESEKANARLQAQLKALDISYKAHEQQIQRVIDKHSQLSGFDDEDLGDSFTNIVRTVGDVNKALDLNVIAMDFARAKNIEVAKAGELVAKVAGGNTGILSRYGITIKEGATATEALGELQERFAGQAQRYGQTTAGANDRARVAIENLGETLGARVTPLIAAGAEAFNTLVRQMTLGQGPGGRIRRVFEDIAEQAVGLAGAVRGLVQWFQRHRTATTVLLSVATGLTAAFVAYKVAAIAAAVATRVLSAAFLLLNVAMRANPIGLAVTGLIALGAGLVTAYKRSETFRKIVNTAFAVVKTQVQSTVDVIKTVAVPVFNTLKAGAEKVADAVRAIAKAFGAVKSALGDAADFANPFGGDGLGQIGPMSIPGLGGTGGLMGADPDLGPFAAIGRGMGLHVSSGIRPGAVTSSGNPSYHASGDAIDQSGPPGAMMRFFRTMRETAGPRLRELIYTPGGIGIKDGRPYTYSGQVAQDHFDHVHLAFTGPFGDGIGQAASAARAAGFRGRDLITAVAIAGPESSYRNSARLVTGAEDSRGMWQINTLAHPWARSLDLSDPNVAARAAYKVYRQAGGFGPWTAFSSGSYRGFVDRARAAVEGSRGGPSAGGGGGIRAEGPSSRGETPTGPGGPLGHEGQLARVGVREARAQASDNLPKLISARKAKLAILRRRLRLVTKELGTKMRRARRVRLLREQAELVEEIDALRDSITEYQADAAGGATTITRADELDAGVDTSAGGGGADTGGDDGTAAAIAALTAEMTRTRQFNEWLATTQKDALVAAVVAMVNGSIGGMTGLGMQGIRSPVGSVAGL